ncbi:MAG: putative damage-inducible protein DinB [Planctomycetota bacterium]
MGSTLESLLGEFAERRRAGIDVLTDMQPTEDNLARTGTYPEFGSVTLGQLIATWVVHDLRHIGQISRAMAARSSSPLKNSDSCLGPLEPPVRVARTYE